MAGVMLRYWLPGAVLLSASLAISLEGEQSETPLREMPIGLGKPVDAGNPSLLRKSYPPDGEGLPHGFGTYESGKVLYENQCAACHGTELAGTRLARPLVGGRGSLASDAPTKTVESYWPYSTTLFSYIRNAMPPSEPGSLTANDTYALTAYILGFANIISEEMTLTHESLPDVAMPNRDGFVQDPRPDTRNVALD